MIRKLLYTGIILATSVWAQAALAQVQPGEEGYSRIQGRDTGAQAGPSFQEPGSVLRDFREDMRRFVMDISRYARDFRPGFSVVIEDGLELLEKKDSVEEGLTAPARTLMRSIDGVLVTGLLNGEDGINQATPESIRQERLARLKRATDEGLQVLLLDFANDPAIIDSGYQSSRDLNARYYAAPSPDTIVSKLAPHPKRPFDENPLNVLTLDAVQNYAFFTNSARMGRMDEYALKMQATNYDLLIVSPFHGRAPLSRRAVETLKYKKIGARRLVFARIDIGMAPSYAYFWQPDWRPGSPNFVGMPSRNDPDLYTVLYWTPEWQQIIFGDTQSFVYGLIAQGYDGVVLTGLDAFQFFETGGDPEEDQ